MPGIHVRNVPPETLEALKLRAAAHYRSLQGEIRTILDRAAKAAPPREGYPPIRLHQVEVGGSRSWSREEIYGDEGR